MAEVRPIPSAVGAFEAQVFDLSSLTRQLSSQVAAQRKAQQEAKKEADKAIAELSTARAGGRSQDLPYLNGLYNEVTNYYSQNSGRLQPGTEQYKKFNELKANFLYETQRSKNEKEKQLRFDTYASVNASKEMMSDDSKELVRVQRLALNDPGRVQFTKKLSDGREVGIDDLDLPDLEKISRFDEVELQKNIESVDKVDVETTSFTKNLAGLNLGAPVIQSKVVQMRRPSAVIDMYAATYKKTPDAKNVLDSEWNSLTPEEKIRVNAEFRNFSKVYQAAGIKEAVTVDESDKTKGISNGFEYGAYKALKNTLPMEIKQDFDLSVANFLNSQRRFNAWMQANRQKTQGQAVYKWVGQTITSGRFDPQEIKSVINPAISSGSESLTSATPAFVDLDKTGKGVLLTNVPIKVLSEDGKSLVPVTGDYTEAAKAAKKVKGVSTEELKGSFMQTNRQGLWKDPQSGVWFQRRVRNIDWSPGPGQLSRISSALIEAREAQTSEEGKKLIDAMMTEKTTVEGGDGSFIMNF